MDRQSVFLALQAMPTPDRIPELTLKSMSPCTAHKKRGNQEAAVPAPDLRIASLQSLESRKLLSGGLTPSTHLASTSILAITQFSLEFTSHIRMSV